MASFLCRRIIITESLDVFIHHSNGRGNKEGTITYKQRGKKNQ